MRNRYITEECNKILNFWKLEEYFTPSDYPELTLTIKEGKQDIPFDAYYNAYSTRSLPLKEYKAHNEYLRQKHKSDEKLYNRANVYCGCYKIKTFVEKMAEKCKLDMEKYAEINELSGRFYIFSVQIDLDGKLTEEGVQISPFFYAVLCMIKSEGINVNIMQEDICKLNEDVNELLKQNDIQILEFTDITIVKNIVFDKLGVENESQVGLEGASDKVYACKGLKKEDETSDFFSFYLDEIERVQKNYKNNEHVSIMVGEDIKNVFGEITTATKGFIMDVTPFFRDDERSLSFALVVEKIIENMQDDWPVFFIIDRRYTYGFQDLLFHRLEKVESLEVTLGLQFPESKDIVGLDEKEFKQLLGAIQDGLVGNEKFKRRFEEELRKYRVFNKLGYQPIFSVLICGNSGIGKTEVARILTRTLSPDQPFIKINFGNYSDHNALSSLIGSPRGYIGSSKGELSEKLTNSRSKVILIDEFEKCDKQVQNFFLQLLEDGVFTDSLGRDYNLDKYIIVFTANLPSDKITTKISPELLSRFNLKYSFSLLSDKEKETYIENRTALMLKDVQEELNINVSPEKISEIKDIDIKKYSNMRDINAELMKRISDVIYPELFSNGG